LRIVTLFRGADGKLFPPLPDDVVVAGTPQARAFEDAGIEVKLVLRARRLSDRYCGSRPKGAGSLALR
jgi:hypothetical protein